MELSAALHEVSRVVILEMSPVQGDIYPCTRVASLGRVKRGVGMRCGCLVNVDSLIPDERAQTCSGLLDDRLGDP